MNGQNDEQTFSNKKELYNHQVELLKTFLEHGTITVAQYEKSFHDLTEKMFSSQEKPQ